MSKELGVGKDGYQKGGVKIKVPSQNMKVDPRAATEVDDPAKDYLPTGDKVKVRDSSNGRGTGRGGGSCR